jgi:peptidoglycan hydrolase CwlO-like protein
MAKTTARIPKITALGAVASAVLLVLSVLPADAQTTREQLDRARSEASQTKGAYERIARAFADQQSALYSTENRISQTRAELSAAEREMGTLNENLRDRVQRAYRMGGVGFFQFLLEARSFREFSMRVITLQRQSMEDEDLILQLRRTRAELEAKQRELDAQRRAHAEQLSSL